MQASVPRNSYLILFRDKARQHFRRTAIDTDEDQAWFEHHGTPLKWYAPRPLPPRAHLLRNIPVGVLFDALAAPDAIPWAVTVHFQVCAVHIIATVLTPHDRTCHPQFCRAPTTWPSSSTSSPVSRRPTTSRCACHTTLRHHHTHLPQHSRPTIDGLAADTDRHQLWLGLYKGACIASW